MSISRQFRYADASDGKKTGDRTSVGFFIPLPAEQAAKFPPLGDEDNSDPHITFLYVGSVSAEDEQKFLDTASRVFSEVHEVQAHQEPIEYFIHPAKERRVAVVPYRFSRDLSGIRWNLRDALIDAGFKVDDSFPLVWRPHTSLAYLDGLETKYEGEVPTGDWSFDSIEVWGLPKVHTIKFGESPEVRVASKHIDSMTNQASHALMRFLSEVARKLGVGNDTYIVGGAVRNFALGIPAKDLDIVIDQVAIGRPDASDWFAKKLREGIPVETSHVTNNYGVAIISIVGDWEVGGANLKGEAIEIANTRKESYGGEAGKGYKPHMVEPATIQEDLARRDFSVNTLVWRLDDLRDGPEKAEILDILGCGLRDIKEGVLRCPLDPDKTFQDDPSRLLRLVRFSVKYGFKIPPEVEASARRNAHRLADIPSGALANLLIKMLEGN